MYNPPAKAYGTARRGTARAWHGIGMAWHAKMLAWHGNGTAQHGHGMGYFGTTGLHETRHGMARGHPDTGV